MTSDPVDRPTSAAQVTALLERWQAGDEAALEAVAPVLYRELRALAGRRIARSGAESLQPTGLVHEAWIRLQGRPDGFRDRAHFLGAAVLAMRSVLVDRARRLRALRHGGAVRQVPLAEGEGRIDDPRDRLLDALALGEALERLEQASPDAAAVASLRFLCGLGVEETARQLEVSPGKVKKDWAFARAWLRRELHDGRTGEAER